MDEAGWKKAIKGIKAQVKEVDDKAALKEQFEEVFINSVNKALTKGFSFGVLFSGGVDSSLIAFIAKTLGSSFSCYCVGLEDSKDTEAAESAALMLGLRLKTRIFSLEEAKQIIEAVAFILNDFNPVQVGIGCVGYAAAGLAKKDDVEVLLSGLGSENLFAGYDYHVKAKDVNAACWKSLNDMWKQDLKRDYLIAKAMKTKFFAPFLDKAVIRAAMSIPSKYKIGSLKKPFLREVACELGLPNEIAFREKVAAQYGSGFDKALQKIAKLQGFKYKKDYLKDVLKVR